MATSSVPVGDSHSMDQTLFTSLLVLGLDVPSLEYELRTPIDQNMFVNTNRSLGLNILHFLFTCIDEQKAAKAFRDCWPILDKKQDFQFLKTTFELYKGLQQNYGQPIPAVVVMSMFTPGGSRFKLILMTLCKIALHSNVKRKAPEFTVLHFPILSRDSRQNQAKMNLLKASKKYHMEEFIAKQKTREKILRKLKAMASSSVERYRTLIDEEEELQEDVKAAVSKTTYLTSIQRENLMTLSVSEFETKILDDIKNMNNSIAKHWMQVAKFLEVVNASKKVLIPILKRNHSFSVLDGSLYSPKVPHSIYKEHVADIRKMNLQGLYNDNRLNLLSLIQFSNMALKSLHITLHSMPSFTRTEYLEELQLQAARSTSISKLLCELGSKLNLLVPSLMESVSSLKIEVYSSDSWNKAPLEVKLQLCPPTPPLSMENIPTRLQNRKKFAPLQLSPASKRKTFTTIDMSTNLLSSTKMIRAAKLSPKANVQYSCTTHKDESILLDMSGGLVEEAGMSMELVTVDCRNRYQIKKEEENQMLISDQLQLKEEKKNCVDVASNNESLIEVIEKRMNITPKNAKRGRDNIIVRHSIAECTRASPLSVSNNVTPVKPICVSDTAVQFTRLIDATPFNVGNMCKMPGNLSCEESFKTPVPSSQDFLKTPATVIKRTSREGESLEALKTLVSQSPLMDKATPFASKLGSVFEGINFSSWHKNEYSTVLRHEQTEDSIEQSNVEQLQEVSRSNFRRLMEQANQIKLEYPMEVEAMKERRKTVDPQTSKFLTFVENIKRAKDTDKLYDSNANGSHVSDEDENDTPPLHTLSDDFSPFKEFQPTLARLEELLEDEGNNTLLFEETSNSDGKIVTDTLGNEISNHTLKDFNLPASCEIPPEDELFVNSADFEKILEIPDRRSSYLPSDSVFDTLTDSILLDETPTAVLNDENVRAEIRRDCVDVASNNESLIEVIEKRMNITPKNAKRGRDNIIVRHSIAECTRASPLSVSNNVTPVKPICVSDTAVQFTRLIDATPFNVGNMCKMPGNLSCEESFKTPVPSSQDFLKTPATVIKRTSREGESLEALKTLISQSPLMDKATPFASKLGSVFEGINFSSWHKNEYSTVLRHEQTEDSIEQSNVEQLQEVSRSNFRRLMEQANQIKLEYPMEVEAMKERRKTVDPQTSKFLTFVENIKRAKDTDKLYDSNANGSHVSDEDENDTPPLHTLSDDFSPFKEFQPTLARLEELLEDEGNNTLLFEETSNSDGKIVTDTLGNEISNHTLKDFNLPASCEIPPEDELFVNSADFEKILEIPDRRSSYLPSDSVFDTLTDSILLDETPAAVLNDENVRAEIRRGESISSRRWSLLSIGSVLGVAEDLLAYRTRFSVDSMGILDQSDSCLLSVSEDEFD